ncbi:MAG TPA: adenine deaminase [Clostridiales bacterium]|nr:adenine deaminase [Clostridiales bacterium]
MSYTESWSGKINRKLLKKLHIIDVAAGREKADLVLKNATYVNVFSGELDTGDIAVAEGLIVGLGSYEGREEVDMTGKIVCPGFIDAHIHLESSLVSPAEFARAVIPHGTTTVITDPHEITNVMGTDGIDYMLCATEGLPVDTQFMIPSCVPASALDESGANLDYRDIDSFFDHPRVLGLAEMMNFPGVISADAPTVAKIIASQAHHKKIDGHAPGLSGTDLNAYIAAGVYSDHECADIDDAMQKLRLGQFIMIREGTAARNLEALMPLIQSQKYFSRCMFCTDDKHPNDLLEKGHIDYICREAINKYGADPILTVKVACHHAARYFLLNNRGAIAPGYLADFAIIDNFKDFNVQMVFKKGELYYNDGALKDFPAPAIEDYLDERAHDTFHVRHLTESDFEDVRQRGVIGMIPGEIVTTDNGYADRVDLEKDILKIAVIERHKNTHHIGLGYIQGYGLKSGAVATSISHDSHNIIVVGTNADDMAFAANYIVENHGGIVVVKDGKVLSSVVLEIAGIMSDEPLTKMNEELEAAKDAAFGLGVSRGIDPFMTLSFMALPVIPKLRITTRGVIDVETQQYV